MVSQRDLRTGNVDCGETGVAVGSLAISKFVLQSNLAKWIVHKWITRLNAYHSCGPI